MSSTFLGIEIGKRTLDLHQKGMTVIGHNLNNADSDIYSRQRIKTVTMPPLMDPSLNREERPGQIGQGAEIAAVQRDRDIYLDDRINEEISKKEYWKASKELLTQVEHIHDSLGEANLQVRLDRFWSGWQEVAKNPAEPAVRQSMVRDAQNLAHGLNDSFSKLSEMRSELNEKILGETRAVNDLARAIADLNGRIVRAQSAGDNPNDLMDRRDGFVKDLASRIDVRVTYKDNDEVMIAMGGKMVVQGAEWMPLQVLANPENNGYFDVSWKVGEDLINPQAGKLKAYLDVRDGTLVEQMKSLNVIATNVIYSVNELHKDGFDLSGKRGLEFFSEKFAPNDAFANYDKNRDGIEDSTYIYQITGAQKLDKDMLIGEAGVITIQNKKGEALQIPYQPQDRVSQLLEKINLSGANVNAYLNHDGKLVFKAGSAENGPSFVIRHLEDSGNFLTGVSGVLKASGQAGAFDFNNTNAYRQVVGEMNASKMTPADNPAGWIAVNPFIERDGSLVAAADGTDYDGVGGKEKSFGVGDGTIATQIAALRFGNIQVDGKKTFNEFYAAMIDAIGSQGKSAELESQKFTEVVGHLEEVKKSISGVSIDEEMANLITMQHGYKAGAKIVTAMDEMLQTLIRMGA